MDHRLKHLRCGNDHLTRAVASSDEALLNTGELFKLYLNAHIASCDHNTVGYFKNALEIGDSLHIFYLGNDLYRMTAVIVEEAAKLDYVLLAPYK